MTNSYKVALAGMFAQGAAADMKALRMTKLVDSGLTYAEAVIVDEAFERTVADVFTLLGERIDDLAEHLRPPALLYVARGLAANADQLDAFLIEEQFTLMAAVGIPIDTGGAPDCNCVVCTAARAAQGAQPQNQTRH